MKKVLVVLAIFVLALTACGGQDAQDATQSAATTGNGTPQNGPTLMQLVMGTFALEDTDMAVTPEQAEELLPLWKAARALSTSDTAAPEELNSIITQIQEAMTPEQLEAIQNVDLSGEQFAEIAEEFDLSIGQFPGGFDPANLPDDFDPSQGFPGAGQGGNGNGGGGGGQVGGFPGGGPADGQAGGPPAGFNGGGGFAGGNFEDLDPEQQATAEARRASRGGNINVALYDAIIELLESKIV